MNRVIQLLVVLFLLTCENEEVFDVNHKINQPPIAAAGPDQTISLPNNSILLDGSDSRDYDGTISQWLWEKISGPNAFTFVNPNIAKTNIKDLVAGIYQFELNVTDNNGLSAKDTVKISVLEQIKPNAPPVAQAGLDQTIVLPLNTVIIDGSGSTDPDNNILSYQWTKISGPSTFNILNANSAQTQLADLVEGIYEFELKVTDTFGLDSKDTLQINVVSPSPPCADCKIVFVSDRDGNDEIYTCNVDGTNITRLTYNSSADGQPAWSPDGSRIAFIRNITIYGEGDLFIMNADGSNVEQKTFTKRVMNPTWSPDNTRIAFTDMVTNNVWDPKISVMNLIIDEISQLPNTEGSSVNPSPSWSPDGTKIAFDSDWNAWDFISDIFTISPNGTERNLLTSIFFNDYDYWRPAWSSDGKKLSVTIHSMNSLVSEYGSIGLMNADGSGLNIIKTGITMDIWNETRTSWSPEGTRIAYTENKTIKWVAIDGSNSGTIVTNGWDADWKH